VALCAVVPVAVAPDAHGVAKVGLGVAAIKSPAPANVNMWVGSVAPHTEKGKLSAAASRPVVHVKKGRQKGVVVIHALKRIKGQRYRLILFVLRRGDSTQMSKAKSGNEVAIETLEFKGGPAMDMFQTDEINSLVGSNRKPKHKMLSLEDWTAGVAGGKLAADQRSAESRARHDIALNAFLARYAYRQAFDLSDDPDDAEFLRVLGDCCADK
jgi:hypothetical protein